MADCAIYRTINGAIVLKNVDCAIYNLLMTVFARERELEVMAELLKSREPAFLAVYGRRRVGKTHLIREFFGAKADVFFTLTGIHDAKLALQLKNMSVSMEDTFGETAEDGNWFDALTRLRRHVSAQGRDKKVVLFFDELPWLASRRSGFLAALDHLWNQHLSRRQNVILVVCGSAASWMISKVIDQRGGLHGRVTHQMPLAPFTLSETEIYLKGKGVSLTRKQMVELYMAFGGVALYLNQAENGLSAAQIIEKACFSPQGLLRNEFDRLYASLFEHSERHLSVVKALAKTRKGMTQIQLAGATGFSTGGSFTRILRELETSGFILRVRSFGNKRKDDLYRLIDAFSLFHLTWMASIPAGTKQAASNWLQRHNSPSFRSWSGSRFEGICLQHADELLRALRIEVVVDSVSGWQVPEAQVDLVIDRRDDTIHLCELKFYQDELRVTAAMAKKWSLRVELFREQTGTKKNLFTTLVTPFGAKESGAYHDAVSQQISLDDLFRS